ncbi:MAG: hypothetical protein ABSA81_08935, partial [Candidatus Bathyarchaeia archaeon]
VIEKGVENLLLDFSSPEILDEARSIPERDLSLRENSRRRLAAYVGDTTVDIDLEQRTIVHRCPTWSRAVTEKRFCPHVARVFLMVDPERARTLLSLIQSGSGDWRFESKLAVEFPT